MEEENKKKGCARCCEWLRSPTAAIYATYMMSSWGDRMWQFAVGLYLVFFEDGVLLLAAALNFCSSGTVLLFGGLLGNWVDHNSRLKVVRVSLVIQNSGVILSALCVCILLHFNEELHGSSRHLVEAAIIFLAVIANLASVAYKISVEKDWIVVVSEGNSSALANLNAVTRSLDMCSKVMAPALCGLIMSVASLMAGALFIAGWNVVSVVVEYLLLQRVYSLVPRLAYKEGVSDPKGAPMKEMTELNAKSLLDESNEKPNLNETNDATDAAMDNGVSAKNANNGTDGAPLNVKEKYPDEDEGKKKKAKKGCMRTVFDPFITLVRGWHVYARQSVVFAGVSLSCLFMTVLALDSVSVGYLYALGLSELALGLAMAACGVTGIIATFLFTRIRKCMGLERTGVLAFSLEIACLVLCLVSVWAPGSPFDPNYLQNRSDTEAEGSPKQNCELSSLNSTLCMLSVPIAKGANGTLDAAVKDAAEALLGNSTALPGNSTEKAVDKTSAILFVVGVITSRVGLWMADLTVTQLLQENVQEKERGMVNGVQSSLNMLLYLFITLMVFVLPYIETFGILIIVSFCAITAGGLFFLAHACKVHRTHAHQGRGCCGTCCYSDSIDTTVAVAVTKA